MSTAEGIIIVENGKVTSIRNLSEPEHYSVTEDSVSNTLNKLAQAGWKLTGNYELKIRRQAGLEAEPD